MQPVHVGERLHEGGLLHGGGVAAQPAQPSHPPAVGRDPVHNGEYIVGFGK